MGSSRTYRHPPVVEALCEMFFEGSRWDPTLWGAFHAGIKAEFPKKDEHRPQNAEVNFSSSGYATVDIRPQPPRMRFSTAQGDRIVQVADGLLVINHLRPYEPFRAWEPLIFRMLDLYRKLASPRSCARLGLRYINRIELPSHGGALEDYLVVGPKLPEGLARLRVPFLLRFDVPHAAGHRIGVSLATASPEPGSPLSLDLYAMLTPPAVQEFDTLPQVIQTAQRSVEDIFEACITDSLRSVFDRTA